MQTMRAHEVAYSKCHMLARLNAGGVDTDEFKSELTEVLCCEALINVYRARDAAPFLYGFDASIIVGATTNAAKRKGAVVALEQAMLDLARRADDYRAKRWDDLSHLGLQAERDAATPLLTVAKYLIDMCPC